MFGKIQIVKGIRFMIKFTCCIQNTIKVMTYLVGFDKNLI